MSTISIDKQKVAGMVQATLKHYDSSGAHPAEVLLALSECVGRIIVALPTNDLTKRDLVDMCIKHMAQAIESGRGKIEVV